MTTYLITLRAGPKKFRSSHGGEAYFFETAGLGLSILFQLEKINLNSLLQRSTKFLTEAASRPFQHFLSSSSKRDNGCQNNSVLKHASPFATLFN